MDDLIRTAAELDAACERVRSQGVLSLDTEFVWRSTYRARLGVVQFGGTDGCWVLDCLTGTDVSALRELIEDASTVKILHDARQDLAHLRHYTGAVPRNVFDTQLAAAFAGFRSGIGLQDLLFEACGIGLAKTETCSDWTARPLSASQVRYALDDVRYLPGLRDELLRRADALGTRAWLEEDLRRLDDCALYGDVDPATAWLRIRTRHVRLDARGRAILRAVAELRETTAREWNLPRNWLGDDASLVEMAVTGGSARLRHRLHGGRGDTLRALYDGAIARSRALPESECPADPNRVYIREVRAAADAALEWLAGRAEELHVDPTVIASRATVLGFVDDVSDETNPLASGWRHETVGREMAERFGVD